MSPSSFQILFIILITFCNHALSFSPIRSLEYSNDVLQVASRNMYAAYDSLVSKDCIWVFGGYTDQKSLYCYNITSDNITLYQTLTQSVYTRAEGCFFVNHEIYYLTSSANLYSFDFNTDTEIFIRSINNGGGGDMCMASGPDDSGETFYFITPTSRTTVNEFWQYNRTSNLLTQGPSASKNYTRFIGNCVTGNDGYLYLIGGNKEWPIERIDLNAYELCPSTTKWEKIDYGDVYCPDGQKLEIGGSNPYQTTWKQYVFILGLGGGGSNAGEYIGIFNTDTLQLTCSDGEFPAGFGNTYTSHMTGAIGGIKGRERLYTFGGFSGSGDSDAIIISNNLSDFSLAPTSIPTVVPTKIPSNVPTLTPSGQPTNVPTDPTIEPSMQPSGIPSSAPSDLPTTEPSNMPSGVPSAEPSNIPSVEPTDIPSNEPTSVPTFEVNNHNFSAILNVFITSEVYTVEDIDQSPLLTKDVLSAATVGSMLVRRYDIKSVDDIDVEMNNITQIESGKFAIEYVVSLVDYHKLYVWSLDSHHVVTEIENYLLEKWGEEAASAEFVSVEIIEEEMTTTTTTETPDGTPSPTKKSGAGSVTARDDAFGDNDFTLEEYSYIALLIVVTLAVIITLMGLFDKWFFRHNELFKVGTMIIVTMYLLDVVSDVFFVVQVGAGADNTSLVDLILFGLAFLFLILPIFSNYYQLHKSIQSWMTDVDTKNIVNAWIQQYLQTLYAICIIFGSAFTAIELCNSNLLGFNMFNMGLNRRQKALFKNQRLFTTVLLENIPQLGLQIVYAFIKGYGPITIFATIFSLLSITLSVFEFISARLLLNSETVLIIKIQVHSNELTVLPRKKFRNIENHRLDISSEVSKVIDIDYRLIELLMPMQTRNGVNLTFHIRSDASQGPQIMKLIKATAKSGKLAQAFFNVWKDGNIGGLTVVPTIGIIETKELKPEMDLHGGQSDVAAVISLESKAKTDTLEYAMGPTTGGGGNNNNNIRSIRSDSASSAKSNGLLNNGNNGQGVNDINMINAAPELVSVQTDSEIVRATEMVSIAHNNKNYKSKVQKDLYMIQTSIGNGENNSDNNDNNITAGNSPVGDIDSDDDDPPLDIINQKSEGGVRGVSGGSGVGAKSVSVDDLYMTNVEGGETTGGPDLN